MKKSFRIDEFILKYPQVEEIIKGNNIDIEVLKDIYNINAELITNENYNVPLCLNYELL